MCVCGYPLSLSDYFLGFVKSSTLFNLIYHFFLFLMMIIFYGCSNL